MFHKGASSTSVERGFTMSWLVAGMVFGFLFPILIEMWQGTGEAVVEGWGLFEIERKAVPIKVRRFSRDLNLHPFGASPSTHLLIEPSQRPRNVWRTIMDSNIWRTILNGTLNGILWILGRLVAILLALGLFVFCVPAMGGFVIVGNMILKYGSCSRV
jgi:hypothetical protein